MSDQGDVIPQPKRPLGEYTTAELSARRKELEHAVRVLANAPIRDELARLLADVEAEEESREQIASAGRRHAIGN